MKAESIETIVSDAMRRYLRVCSSGGMSRKTVQTVQANVDEAERLGYFKIAIAAAILAERKDCAELFSQPHMEYFGHEIQDAILSRGTK